MASPRTSTAKEVIGLSTKPRGFTLIEVIIVIGIISILGGLSLFIDLNSYRGDAFRAERAALVTALQTARADALNNINENRHGVAIHPSGYNGYIIFEGDSYASSTHLLDEKMESSYSVDISSTSPSEIVFDQLSGNANYDGNIVLIDPARQSSTTISINHEGKISW
jgi:prepilin-type N-terminal cleavage/methylation domain-containing protein